VQAGGRGPAGGDQQGLAHPALPLAYGDRILKGARHQGKPRRELFGGVYQNERNFFAQFAIDHETLPEDVPRVHLPDDQWKAFMADKQGAIAGQATAKRFGWKVGDRIPIKGAIFPGEWEFNLVGIYKGARPNDDLTQFWFRWDYLTDKAPAWAKGFVGWYTVRVTRERTRWPSARTSTPASPTRRGRRGPRASRAFMAPSWSRWATSGSS
jgi:putative ABC transport system permease protein